MTNKQLSARKGTPETFLLTLLDFSGARTVHNVSDSSSDTGVEELARRARKELAGTAGTSKDKNQPREDTSSKKRPAQKTKPPKGKKSKKRKESSSSSSASESDSSSTDSSKSSSDSNESSDESEAATSAGLKKKTNWQLLNAAWDVEKRPSFLQNKAAVNAYAWQELESIFNIFQSKEKNDKGDNLETVAKDAKPVKQKFKKQSDDGRKLLHPARFLRLPLKATKKWWKEVPMARKHTFISIDLEFTGTENKVAERSIKKLHDRSLLVELKNFTSENCAVAAKPRREVRRADSSSITDYDWITPTSIAQVQEGIINYITVNHALWPHDTTGFSMLRLLTRFKWFEYIDEIKTRINLVTAFFNAVMRKNRTAAANKGCILSYQQQSEVLKEVLSSNGISPEPPLKEKAFPSQNQRGGFSQQNDSGVKKNLAGQKARKRAVYKGMPLCYGHNDTKGRGCMNDKTADGCKSRKDGTLYAHRCNVFLNEKGDYCYSSHQRKHHKF